MQCMAVICSACLHLARHVLPSHQPDISLALCSQEEPKGLLMQHSRENLIQTLAEAGTTSAHSRCSWAEAGQTRRWRTHSAALTRTAGSSDSRSRCLS